ncbi:MerR family transcriptional regulator [Mycolicibacterium litorale]|uniref:MerR family transcriptional regulator n=1 Tax=Mycolicibacterium litorale TaxID=758802 RepID=UPI003CE873DD
MEAIPIGEAAAKLKMSTSALRYYDDRGLVHPQGRRSGRRMYGPDELRRLALLKIVHGLGLPLDTAVAVLDAPSEQWRQTVRDQIAELDRVIARARGAQRFLTNALECPTDHPARECPTMTGALDRLVEGMSIEELAAEHAR